MRDLYTSLNRMVENLILRIADQERRLHSLNQRVNGQNPLTFYDHSGHAVAATPRNDISLNALAFNNLTTAPVSSLHALSLRDKNNS